MTSDYIAPDPSHAEFVYQTNAECDRQQQRLHGASANELKIVVRDRSESTAARGTALMGLMMLRDSELNDLICELFDDPDKDLWRMAIEGTSWNDDRIRSRLWGLLDDSDEEIWSAAALGLARRKEEHLLSRLVEWLEHKDEGHRNVAVECLKFLNNPAALAALQACWKSGQGDEEFRVVVAGTLLDLGDQCGLNLLKSTARQAKGCLSVFAATQIYLAQPADGLALMLEILDDGDLEARQAMVSQIWNFVSLPHAFTVDGLSEARVWVQTQLENPIPWNELVMARQQLG